MASTAVNVQKVANVMVVKLASPPVNALGHALRTGIMDAVKAAHQDSSVGGIVLIGQDKNFSAGADITEFQSADAKMGHEMLGLIEAIEESPKPVVAALAGSALGGGLEVALGCHYRVASKEAKLGLPEVRIGLLPGAGGTQRLPRLVGVQEGLTMIVTGKHISADKALAIKLVDKVVSFADLQAEAVKCCQELIQSKAPLRKCSALPCKGGNSLVFGYARKQAKGKIKDMIAPLKCIDAVEACSKAKTFKEGMLKEQQFFQDCFKSPQSKALQHVFFAERAAQKIPGVTAKPMPIKTAAVIGAGTMGGGIAMCFAAAGIPVYVVEVNEGALKKGVDRMKSLWEASASKGKMSKEELAKRIGLVKGTLSYNDLKDVDVVVEAVIENMDLKKKIFSTLDKTCKASTILATNTSTLDINEIATATTRPHKVCGMHFFSPANVMKLLENVRGTHTDAETLVTIMDLGKKLKKVSVMVGVCWGFVSNRMNFRYTEQAEMLLEEGATPAQVDAAIRNFGFPVGPFQMADIAGIDVFHNIRLEQLKAGRIEEGARGTGVIAENLYQMQRIGMKGGKGYYTYAKNSRQGQEDPAVLDMIVKRSKELGVTRRTITDKEIVERCMYALANEAAAILEEGIAIRPSDVDVVWVFGFGFPPHKGGPLQYADQVGVAAVNDVAKKCRADQGEKFWVKSQLLEDLVAKGKTFASLQK